MSQEKAERIQKILAERGIASRRKAEEMIAAGHVKVNGVTAKLGDKADPERDKITVHGKPVAAAEKEIYVMLHKPRGFVTTMQDEMGRKCITELTAEIPQRVYPIGRLDRDSEGLLLLTNDGDFAHSMMHPSMHVPKTYRVTVRPAITEDMLTKMTVGMMVDGQQTLPAQVRVLEQQQGRVVLEIVLYEGKNRQIRKMCEQLGLEIARLKRIAYGPVKLGMLQPGKWRELSKDELKRLKEAVKKDRLSERTETDT